ncbi:hypothetical protein [Sphingomonas paeninsulae]|uniref:hypothetical protein n=1 Tax=Sphingomonas paeninsulae TaxID=2319844 RepID=UPI0013CF1632|nr:hypothetical protein [Sphingomonas paeninsulae]
MADYTEGRDTAKSVMQIKVQTMVQQGLNDRTIAIQTGLSERQVAQLRSDQTIAKGNNETTRDVASGHDATSIKIASMEAASRLEVARANHVPGSKPPPAQIAKLITDQQMITDGLGNASYDIEPVIGAIQSGQLTFSALSNARQTMALTTGVGANEMTPLYSQYKTMIEGLRNALLLANKGVQTDGDADRAMANIMSGSGDQASIVNNLRIVQNSLARRKQQSISIRDSLSKQYGYTGGEPDPQDPSPTPAQAPPKRPLTHDARRSKYGF